MPIRSGFAHEGHKTATYLLTYFLRGELSLLSSTVVAYYGAMWLTDGGVASLIGSCQAAVAEIQKLCWL